MTCSFICLLVLPSVISSMIITQDKQTLPCIAGDREQPVTESDHGRDHDTDGQRRYTGLTFISRSQFAGDFLRPETYASRNQRSEAGCKKWTAVSD